MHMIKRAFVIFSGVFFLFNLRLSNWGRCFSFEGRRQSSIRIVELHVRWNDQSTGIVSRDCKKKRKKKGRLRKTRTMNKWDWQKGFCDLILIIQLFFAIVIYFTTGKWTRIIIIQGKQTETHRILLYPVRIWIYRMKISRRMTCCIRARFITKKMRICVQA